MSDIKDTKDENMGDVKVTEDSKMTDVKVIEEDSKVTEDKVTAGESKITEDKVTADVDIIDAGIKEDSKTTDVKVTQNTETTNKNKEEDLKMADVKVTVNMENTDTEISEDLKITDVKVTENSEMTNTKDKEEDLKMADVEITEDLKTTLDKVTVNMEKSDTEITGDSKITDAKVTIDMEINNAKVTEEDAKVPEVNVSEKDLKPLEVDLDRILGEIGLFGIYQLKYFILLFLPVILTSIHADNYIFAAQDTKLRCKTICDGPGVEFEPPWLENAIPKDDWCYIYPNSSSSTKADDSCPAEWFDQSSKVACDEYVFSEEYSFIEEIGIACEDWKRTLIGTIHSVGTLVALPFIGYVSDRFGRKFTLVLSCVFEGALGLIKSFSVNYGMYLAFEFLEPCIGSGVYTAAYVMVMEILVPRSRAAAATVVNIYFGLGQAIMSGISWGLPYWRTFLQVSYAPTILLFVLWWMLDESSRWLLSKDKYKEVIKNVYKVAKVNGRSPSEESMMPLRYNAENKSKFVKKSEKVSEEKQPSDYLQVIKSRIIVVRLLKCSFWWITCTFCFYGLSINAVALAGTFHLNFIFSALVEVPAHLLGLFGMDFIGRKWTIFISFVIGGLANFSFAFTPENPDLQWVSMTCYLIGKLFVTLAFSSIYLYTSELFPTNLRHSLLAFCSMIGRIGSILAPQTPLLAKYMDALPAILFGSTCIISALLMLTSPETLHLRLPETVEEAENLSSLIYDKKKESTDEKNP